MWDIIALATYMPGDDPFRWRFAWIRHHPIAFVGVLANLVFRAFFGLFFFLASLNKFQKGWLTTDELYDIYMQRLTELNPDSFAAAYLEGFAIPLYLLIAWVVTLGELAVGIGLLLGILVRIAALGGFFILFNLAIGGYYDASLIPFFILAIVFIAWPSGRWLGLDQILHRFYPRGWLFH